MQRDFSFLTSSRACSLTTRVAAAALLVGSFAAPASAAIVEYTSRANFLASAGPTTTETFDAVAIDSQFRTQSFNLGPFAIAGFGPNQDTLNVINPSSAAIFDYNVNLTPYVLGETSVGTGFTITFSSAIKAFGADFRGFNNLDYVPRSVVSVDGNNLSPPVVPGNNDASFFGFTSDTAFTAVTFMRNPDYDRVGSSDGFGMDNLTYSGVSAVPEPSTWAMIMLGFAGMGLMAYRREAKPVLIAV